MLDVSEVKVTSKQSKCADATFHESAKILGVRFGADSVIAEFFESSVGKLKGFSEKGAKQERPSRSGRRREELLERQFSSPTGGQSIAIEGHERDITTHDECRF